MGIPQLIYFAYIHTQEQQMVKIGTLRSEKALSIRIDKHSK